MSKQRQQHSVEFKAKVALKALKELKTVPELAHEYTVHPTRAVQCSDRVEVLIEALPQI